MPQKVRPLRRHETGAYRTRDGRFEIHRRDTGDAWHVIALTDEDEELCPPERFATLRGAAEELQVRLDWRAEEEAAPGGPDPVTGRCPDDGACHHSCAVSCFRVRYCGPLSNVYPGDTWPDAVRKANEYTDEGWIL